MKIDFSKPELIYWMLIPITILFGISSENQTMEIQLHDTFIIIENIRIVIIVSVMLFIHGLIYWAVLRKNFIRKGGLILANIIFAVLGLYILANFGSFKEEWFLAMHISILLLTSFLIGILLMLVYLSSGLIKKINNQ